MKERIVKENVNKHEENRNEWQNKNVGVAEQRTVKYNSGTEISCSTTTMPRKENRLDFGPFIGPWVKTRSFDPPSLHCIMQKSKWTICTGNTRIRFKRNSSRKNTMIFGICVLQVSKLRFLAGPGIGLGPSSASTTLPRILYYSMLCGCALGRHPWFIYFFKSLSAPFKLVLPGSH